MGENDSKRVVAVPSFPMLLGLLFITLKLVGTINWSWWWVLAPFWIPPAILLGFAVLILIAVGFLLLIGKVFDWNPKTPKTPKILNRWL